MFRKLLSAALLIFLSCGINAAELTLAENGKSAYQIVLPDKFPDPAVALWLNHTAKLLQTAFKTDGCDLPIVQESRREKSKPGIYIGNTEFARTNAVDVSKFKDWTYVQKAVGKDLIITGNDQPDQNDTDNTPRICLLGTVKGVTDFLRQYCGTRFLYPNYSIHKSKGNATQSNGIDPRSIEFTKMDRVAIPSDLNVRKSPELLANYDFQRETFYHVAQNAFPMIGGRLHQHTYDKAVPAAKYKDTHPEYFALLGGKRACDIKGTKGRPSIEQYCISNPGFQELVYKYMLDDLDKGKEVTTLGQPDAFRPCECEECRKLYNTGDDWGEKIWIFHRSLAERLMKDRPGKKVAMLCYQRTSKPPKTFTKFPESAMLYILGDATDQQLEEWKKLDVPGGFIAYIHTWGGYHQGSPYSPVRTPDYVGKLVQKLHDCNVRIILKDGSMGFCWGLEGPAYYVYGRMFADVGKSNVNDLLEEFYSAAFGKAAPAMKRFYGKLYKQIELYSDTLGTHCPAWIQTRYHGNFSLIGFLYSPDFLIAAEKDLQQAEKTADSDRVKARIELVRVEFDYLKGLSKIIHLYQAYQLQQNKPSFNALLDAIDSWHEKIYALYDDKGNMKPVNGWPEMVPFVGHSKTHVALENNGYQNFYKDTCLNWDTKSLRNKVFSGSRDLTVKPVKKAPEIGSALWDAAPALSLVSMKNGATPSDSNTTVKALYDKNNLYLLLESDKFNESVATAKTVERDGDFDNELCMDVSIAPFDVKDKFYHFIVGPAGSKYDAAFGFVTDPIDPRCGKDDVAWNGEWAYTAKTDKASGKWIALLKIPFKTLGVKRPSSGSIWGGNIGCGNRGGDKSGNVIWSFAPGLKDFSDSKAFGNLMFE